MKKTLLLLLLLWVVNPLWSQKINEIITVKSGLSYQYIGSYDIAKLNNIATQGAEAFSEFKVTYGKASNGVKLYRVTYASVIPEMNNKPTIASGLLAVPDNAKGDMPVLSYQHGTVFGKTDVPSFPDESAEIRMILCNFAANGYVVIAADNFGKGTSTESDAYQITASTQQADLDMLYASQAILSTMNIQQKHLFLGGWSMGSWSTQMFIQKLQSLQIPVKAAFIAANPTDIFVLVNSWLNIPKAIDAVWLPAILALQLNAYSVYYDIPGLAATAIKEEYQQAAADYYNNKIDFNAFLKQTTTKISEFIKPEFIASGISGQGRYWNLIKENSAHRFVSSTPINAYYGESDEAVSVYVSSLLGGYQEALGGTKVNTYNAGKDADHRGTYKYAIQHAKTWFDSLLK
jgi:hypothetical protein